MSTPQTELLKKQAYECLERQQFTQAIALYHDVCQMDPLDAESRLRLGAITGEMGNITDSISHIQQAIQLDPEFSEAYLALAMVLRSQMRLEEAKQALESAVKIDADYTEAWMILGTIHGQLGAFNEAVHCCNTALQIEPNLQDAQAALNYFQAQAQSTTSNSAVDLINQAVSHFQNSQSTQALQLCNQALELDPKLTDAWLLLSVVHGQSGNFTEAARCSEALVKIAPQHVGAYINLGHAQRELGNTDQALISYRHATEFGPDNPEAWISLGALTGTLSLLDEAARCYRHAVTLMPNDADSLNQLATILRLQGHFEEAVETASKAIELDPSLLKAHINLGDVLSATGNLDTANTYYNTALALDPGNIDAISGIARNQEQNGQFDQALASIQPLIDQKRLNHRTVAVFANLSRHFKHHDQAIALVESVLETNSLSLFEQTEMHFSAGTLYDKTAQYEKAFSHYKKGNDLKQAEFDQEQHHRFIDRLIETFSADNLAHLPTSENPSDTPIFIIGMPRSGTTLVEQIIASHPNAFGADERAEISIISHQLQATANTKLGYPESVESITPQQLNDFSNQYISTLQSISAGETRITDKMPSNFQHLGLIQLLFPHARIIHVSRNPLDTCLSCYFQNFSGSLAYAYNLSDLGHYYNDYARLMKHWQAVLNIPVLNINYEELVENPDTYIRSLIEFCELPWNDRCLDFHQSDRLVKTSSYDQVRQPIYLKSVARWRNYEKFLSPLTDTIIQN